MSGKLIAIETGEEILEELAAYFRGKLVGPILENTEEKFIEKYTDGTNDCSWASSDIMCLGKPPTILDLTSKYGL